MKIAVVCRGSQIFLGPLLEDWINKGYEIVDSIRDADVIFSEWANEQSILSTLETNKQNVVIRLHGSEYFQNYHSKWNKRNVFGVIKANPEYTIDGVNNFNCGIPIDTEFWNDKNRSYKQGKLLMVGSFVYSKGHINLLNMLVGQDFINEIIFVGDYKNVSDLYRSAETNKVLNQINYIKNRHNLPVNIIETLNKEDLRELYKSCDYIVSNSTNEGFHSVIPEGILCGCYPLIYDWKGARHLYPFRDPFYINQSEFLTNLTTVETFTEKTLKKELLYMQSIIKDFYNKDKVLNKIDNIIFEAARSSL